ncbi:hypothetical protein ACFOD4_13650 [Pseudoroseomonas globiformis]|uniref:DUF3618 domain-containing protein n=1 Tax=Teichococcus globiformis TaxID=2307229 RepID=A0ABV7G0B9_9PROT
MNPNQPEQTNPSLTPVSSGTKPFSGTAGAEGQTGSVAAEARATAGDVKAQGQEALADIKDAGADVAAAAKSKAEDLAERGKQVGADRGEGLAGAARRVADDLEETSPEIARHVRSAADSISSVSASLRDRSVGDLLNEVNGFARRQPAAFFGAAVLAGFAITRFAKSSSESGGAGSGMMQGASTGVGPHGRAPGWVPDGTDGNTSASAPIRPATMPAATLGGAVAHQGDKAKPGSMPTIEGSTS